MTTMAAFPPPATMRCAGESLAIVEYLDETHSLLPADPHGRARVHVLAQAIAGDNRQTGAAGNGRDI